MRTVRESTTTTKLHVVYRPPGSSSKSLLYLARYFISSRSYYRRVLSSSSSLYSVLICDYVFHCYRPVDGIVEELIYCYIRSTKFIQGL